MDSEQRDSKRKRRAPRVNPGYAHFQIARALRTAESHPDPETRERAASRLEKWVETLEGVVTGAINVGSRAPLTGVPIWATLEVLTGGFATGNLLAGGSLQAHELDLLAELNAPADEHARRLLNGYFITDEGIARLQGQLQEGTFEIRVPEEGALLVVAWLVDNGRATHARELLDRIGPWFDRLRFYPLPRDRARSGGARVAVQNVQQTIATLRRIEPNREILAQKETVEVWLPLYDRMVALVLDTVEGSAPTLRTDPDGGWRREADGRFPIIGGWPCRHYPDGWMARARALIDEFDHERAEHTHSSRSSARRSSLAQLAELLRRCVQDPAALTGRDVGRIRLILARSIAKRGIPGSAEREALRNRQARQVAGATHHEIAQVLLERLSGFPIAEPLDDIEPVIRPVDGEEAARWEVDEGTGVPPAQRRKVRRALRASVERLVELGVITSGDTLATVLPQISAGIRAAAIDDPTLRDLYGAIYQAFRRRRSLLLLDLQSQVRFEELPWVAAIEPFRTGGVETQEIARQSLTEAAGLAIAAFPHAILPNKLLQELRALVKDAGLNLPLVDEVAADIFMGAFSDKFLAAARVAAEYLDGTLYTTYYGIDADLIRRLAPPRVIGRSLPPNRREDSFAALCAARAGVKRSGWSVAANGMIIEQQQILTTQNLAVLFEALALKDALGERLHEMPRACFRWVCRRLQVRTDHRHASLIQVKNGAYAWRQMIFYLSLLSHSELDAFMAWAEAHLAEQPTAFGQRFRPAIVGLAAAVEGRSVDRTPGARRYLGWSDRGHWLLDAP